MDKKLTSMIIGLIVLIDIVPAAALADVSVGVKQGDWIEYQVAYTGTPPESHAISWARMEIVGVQGAVIDLNVTTRFSNGTLLNEAVTLNLEIGQLGDEFIIPANLNRGDTFFDEHFGNITISGVEQRTYVDATRFVVYASTPTTKFYWDRSTGVFVEASSSLDGYILNSKADKTDMWQPQILGLDPTVFYALLIVAAVAVLIVIVFFVARRKMKRAL
jgi:hypothetical protein